MSDSTNKLLQAVAQQAELVVFQPTAAQRRAKSNFWSHFLGEGDIQVPSEVTEASASRLGADRRISQWWASKEFRDWFQNKDEFRQRLEYLTHLVLDTFEGILSDIKANAGAKVQAGKIILEAASKMPRGKGEDKYADAQISQMDRAQLEQFIQTSLKRLNPMEVDVTPDPVDS